MQLQVFGDTVQARLRHWRQEVAGVSQAQLCEDVNRYLPEDEGVAVTTVSNYERTTEPRASFLGALKKAYPDLNLDWLVSGEGKLLAAEQRIASVLRVAQAEKDSEAGSAAHEQPGMQRFRQLPETAAHVVLAFLEEVRLSTPEYSEPKSRAWRDFLQRFAQIFFTPFQSARHFTSVQAVSDHELTTYALTLVAAVRPLVLPLRGRQPGHPPAEQQSPPPSDDSS